MQTSSSDLQVAAHLQPQAVEAPLLDTPEDRVQSDPFSDSLDADPTIRKHGKFHFRGHTFWWMLAKDGFGTCSTEEGDLSPNAAPFSRQVHVEFATSRDAHHVLHCLTLGRLGIRHSRSTFNK